MYIDFKLLNTKIDLKMLSDTFMIKQKAARRLNQRIIKNDDLMHTIATGMMVTMILNRIDVVKTGQGFDESFEMFMQPNRNDVVVNDSIDGIFMMRLDFQYLKKPDEVIPFDISLFKPSTPPKLQSPAKSFSPTLTQPVVVSQSAPASRRSSPFVSRVSSPSTLPLLDMPRCDSDSNMVRLQPLSLSLLVSLTPPPQTRSVSPGLGLGMSAPLRKAATWPLSPASFVSSPFRSDRLMVLGGHKTAEESIAGMARAPGIASQLRGGRKFLDAIMPHLSGARPVESPVAIPSRRESFIKSNSDTF
jgi:hypothetical protein